MLLDRMSIAQLDDTVHGDGEGSGYAGQVAGIPSLCIPALNLEDGPQGVGDATKPE
jgi:beta-glucosidase